MSVITRPPHTAAIEGIMIIASIREVGECLVYLTSWLLCRPRGPLTLRQSGKERRRLSSAENTDLHMATSWMHIVYLGVKHEAGLGKPGNVSKCPTYSSGPDKKLCIQIRLLLKKTAGCNGSDITPEVEFLSSCIFFSLNVNLIHSHTAVVFEDLLFPLLLLSTISVKHHLKFKPRFVLSSCWSTNSVCVYTHWWHCQTHVWMAPDIQIFSFSRVLLRSHGSS